MSESFLPQTLVAISAAGRAVTELGLTARTDPRLLRAIKASAQRMEDVRKVGTRRLQLL
jgi:hypothetical protein